jgi:hypothetical protein
MYFYADINRRQAKSSPLTNLIKGLFIAETFSE